MRLEDLTPEQQEKAKACKTPEDILALAQEEGYELTDEELNAAGVAGGGWCAVNLDECPDKCGGYCPSV